MGVQWCSIIDVEVQRALEINLYALLVQPELYVVRICGTVTMISQISILYRRTNHNCINFKVLNAGKLIS